MDAAAGRAWRKSASGADQGTCRLMMLGSVMISLVPVA